MKNEIIVIELADLLENALVRKNKGWRLSQICAAFRDGHYELSYSFADDETLDFETLRVNCPINSVVPSISELYSAADFYENEMKELFGVEVKMMKRDYHRRLYRIKAQTPFLSEEDRAKLVRQPDTLVPGAVPEAMKGVSEVPKEDTE
ncbi:MAG: NADH-quinone oxidoreductase subunit C [Lachnospiraceae bacterium]|jgi:ech hydrogenase subunit D|nr:NADH-quinone oxidoreductase subunit C [Lachnospiraceae bacterium]MCR5211787.1 NADH-quinone oxidoreductase subunit C [Lachnospiraceae bacterium]